MSQRSSLLFVSYAFLVVLIAGSSLYSQVQCSKQPGAITRCSDTVICHGSWQEGDCRMATGPNKEPFDPDNCPSVASFNSRARWDCVGVPQTFLACENSGPATICCRWLECISTDTNPLCHTGQNECNWLPLVIAYPAVDVWPNNCPNGN